ncbi:hypothetical protein HU200_039625 [Digitaria exilis]|uniref:BHLH domain-containing protein n=1 Tax=Digitaria exilis TaxID=1010633 RepID=A0A835BII0_9POAL|nr:hypothetical protein HU200_039625 [Digitaria exilis]
MAAHACCHDVDAVAAPVAARRFKSRRPSRSTQLVMKARKLRKISGAGRRRPGPVASRKRVMVIRRKMEALRSLVPACGDGDDGRLEELLLHAAGYIVRLQMQVRVMQVMVHALNNPPED